MSSKETLIETDAIVRGRVSGEDDVRVLGTLVGSVEVAAKVTVEASGLVEGEIEADEVLVLGTVRGDISARRRAVLEAGARVLGDLSTLQLVLREGARLRGRVRTDGGPATHLAGLETAGDTPSSEVPWVSASPVDEPSQEPAAGPPARDPPPPPRPRAPRLKVKVRRRPQSPEVT